MKDDYIIFRLYVPIGIMLLLIIMLFFHRQHILKYLYLINIFCLLAAVFAYFVLIKHPVGNPEPGLWMQAMPFIWLVGLFGGYALSFLSVATFVTTHAQRYLWAKVVIGITCLIFLLLCLRWGYLLIKGILSLKSG